MFWGFVAIGFAINGLLIAFGVIEIPDFQRLVGYGLSMLISLVCYALYKLTLVQKQIPPPCDR